MADGALFLRLPGAWQRAGVGKAARGRLLRPLFSSLSSRGRGMTIFISVSPASSEVLARNVHSAEGTDGEAAECLDDSTAWRGSVLSSGRRQLTAICTARRWGWPHTRLSPSEEWPYTTSVREKWLNTSCPINRWNITKYDIENKTTLRENVCAVMWMWTNQDNWLWIWILKCTGEKSNGNISKC